MIAGILEKLEFRVEILPESSVLEADSLWIQDPPPRDWPHRLDLELLRETFSNEAEELESTKSKYLYISRSRSARSLFNEAELEGYLEKRGFRIVHLEDLPFEQQVDLMSHARVVVGPHGAGLANIAFMKPGGKVFEITSGEWLSPAFRRISAASGHDYRLLILKDRSHSLWGAAEETMNLIAPLLDELGIPHLSLDT
jgi:capsular polysaccharide biosynthesis protein